MTEAEIHLTNPAKLFRQARPALTIAVNATWALISLAGPPPLWLYYVAFLISLPAVVAVFNTTGALAMEPLGEVAGTAYLRCATFPS